MSSLTTDELKLLMSRKEAARSAIKFFSKSLFGIATHTGIKTVKSANNPFDGLKKHQREQFYSRRDDYRGATVKYKTRVYSFEEGRKFEDIEGFLGYTVPDDDKIHKSRVGIKPDGVAFSEPKVKYVYEDSLLGSISQTMRTGMGNCDEKGKICYAALKCNPRLTDGKSAVSLVSSNNLAKVMKNGEEELKEMGYDHVFVVVADMAVPDHFVKISSLGRTAMIVDGWTQDWYFPNLSVFDAKWHNLGNTPNPRQLVVRGNVKKNPTRNYGPPIDAPSNVVRFF